MAALVYRLGYDWRKTVAAGALMSSRLSLIIAVAAIGLNLGGIDEATNAAIVLVAIVTSTVSPLLFNRILPETPVVQRKFVVVGAGKQPRLLARRIQGHGQAVVVLDRDPQRKETVEAMGLRFVQGDATNSELWAELDPSTIQAVAVMLPDDAASLQVARLVREELGIQHVVARVHDATLSREFSDLGVEVVNPSLSPVVELEYLLLYPSVSSLIGDLEDEHEVAGGTVGLFRVRGPPAARAGVAQWGDGRPGSAQRRRHLPAWRNAPADRRPTYADGADRRRARAGARVRVSSTRFAVLLLSKKRA